MFVLSLLLNFLVTSTSAQVCTDEQCVFTFDVRWRKTMTYVDEATGTEYDVGSVDGHLEIIDGGEGETDPLHGRHIDPDDIITGDGTRRRVITVNGQFPGPTMKVQEHSEIVVHVKNNLDEDGLTIHWHGIHQRDTQWHDGVEYITQCPLAAGSSFTYKFKAYPGGTHWYHSHLLNQRDDGLYGAMIIQRLPSVNRVLILSQLYKHEAKKTRELAAKIDELKRHGMHASGKHDIVLEFQVHNVLINGRGREHVIDDAIPWSVIPVEASKDYVFHVIHAGADYAYKVAIDGHSITILAMDGFQVKPTVVDAFCVYPGESIECELSANQDAGQSYWIRVEESQLHEFAPGEEHSMVEEVEKEDGHGSHHGGAGGHGSHGGHGQKRNTLKKLKYNASYPSKTGAVKDMSTDDYFETRDSNKSQRLKRDVHLIGRNTPNRLKFDSGHPSNIADGKPLPSGKNSDLTAGKYSKKRFALQRLKRDVNHSSETDNDHHLLKDDYSKETFAQQMFKYHAGYSSEAASGRYLLKDDYAGERFASQRLKRGAGHPSKPHGSKHNSIGSHGSHKMKLKMKKPNDGKHMGGHGRHQMKLLKGLAILAYQPQESVPKPISKPKHCSRQHRCVVFNCPGGSSFGPDEKCILYDAIHGMEQTNSDIWAKLKLLDDPDHKYVTNFMFSGKPGATGSSVNGLKFTFPPVPMYESHSRENECAKCENCSKCANILEIPANKVVEITFANLQSQQPIYSHHPIHLHGYAFAVMKVGYPVFDRATKTWKTAKGIACKDKYCTEVERIEEDHHRRRRAAEHHGVNPVLKDTVLVPARGFVDVRIFTDNPGFWFMHCHVNQHILDGMAIIVDIPGVPNAPGDMPSCLERADAQGQRSSGVLCRISHTLLVISLCKSFL